MRSNIYSVKYEDSQLDEKNDKLTIYYTHEVDGNLNAHDVEAESVSTDLSEFKTWVLETVKDDDTFDLGGQLPNGLTFYDFWDTLSVSQQTEWHKEWLQVMVSESVIVARQFRKVVKRKSRSKFKKAA